MERLKHEIYELLKEAIGWWGRQEICNEMEGVEVVKKYRSLEERLRLYEEVIKLRKQGLGYARIAKSIEEKYGFPLNPSTIRYWVKGKRTPLGRCNRIVEGPELAYVVSAWLGDGELALDRRNYKHHVKLAVKDYDFAEEWGRRLAEALGRSKPYTPRWDNDLQRWVVKGSSALLYDLLKRAREGDPWILMPYLEKYPAEACRGSFDAEGSVNINRYQIEACNTNSRTIGLFEGLLGKLGIDCRMHKFRWDEFMKCPKTGKLYRRNSGSIMCLAIYGEDNIMRFAEKIGFTIARKRAALMELVRSYRRC